MAKLILTLQKNNKNIISINARFNKPQGILGFLSKDIYKRTLDKVDHIYCKSKRYEVFPEYISSKKVSSVGNIKHALVDEDAKTKKIIEKKYVLLASSHHREEIIIIKEWLKLKSNKYLLVVAPRHPERLGDILSDIPLSGINLAIRSSRNEKIRNSTQIYIADTLGEMTNLIKYSEFTIFGGSFVDVGGHSFMEAAIHSKAIIVGPFMYNFVEETEEFLKNNALIMCQKPEMLKNIFLKTSFRSKSKRVVFEENARN